MSASHVISFYEICFAYSVRSRKSDFPQIPTGRNLKNWTPGAGLGDSRRCRGNSNSVFPIYAVQPERPS
jgi:hypothetical protein